MKELGFGIPVVPGGAFYIYADCSRLASDSFELSRRILMDAHVAITPGKDFGANEPEKHVRIAYTNSIDTLREAVGRIGRLF